MSTTNPPFAYAGASFGGHGPLADVERTWHAVFSASTALGGGNVDSARLATTVALGTPFWDGNPPPRPGVPLAPAMRPPAPQPPAAAVANGHDLHWDPPSMSAAQRWTCRACGAAAIRYEVNEYGTACEETCDEVAARHRAAALARGEAWFDPRSDAAIREARDHRMWVDEVVALRQADADLAAFLSDDVVE